MRKFENTTWRREYDEEVKLPARSTKSSAGYDFFSPIDFYLAPGETLMVKTDVKVCMEPDEVLMLFPRSSMGKFPIVLRNTIGVIDADYYNNEDNEGNIGLKFINKAERSGWAVHKGDKIAQGIFTKFLVTDDDVADGRRVGGFGSTGK